MNQNAFLSDLTDILEVSPDELVDGFELNNQNWHSFAVVATMAAINEYFGITIKADLIVKCKNIKELLELINDNIK